MKASSLKSVIWKNIFTSLQEFLLTIYKKLQRINGFFLDEVDFEPVIQIKTPEELYISADIINHQQTIRQLLSSQMQNYFSTN